MPRPRPYGRRRSVRTYRGRYNSIFRAICSYVGAHGVEGTDLVTLREQLREAIRVAPPGHRGRAEIERYTSARYLDDQIQGVLVRKEAERRQLDDIFAFAAGPTP